MRKVFAILVALLVLPIVYAADGDQGIGGGIDVEDFEPRVFQCGWRILWDEEIQPWRITGYDTCDGGICDELDDVMIERTNQYAFRGEKLQMDVLVFDKNKIDDVTVDMEVDGIGIVGGPLTINCVPTIIGPIEYQMCNARIDEEKLVYDPDTMQAYTCSITVLGSDKMAGEAWIDVVATSAFDDMIEGRLDEAEYWFFNPKIELALIDKGIPGLDFDGPNGIRPGTSSYTQVVLQNKAEGGVLLDMFVTGSNWEPTDQNLGRCYDPLTGNLENYLSLGAFRYYAVNGAYNTRQDVEDDTGYSSICRDVDAEGYVNINYLLNAGFEEAMFNDAEIIQAQPIAGGLLGYYGNFLRANSAGMTITFRLDLPEPCYGNFAASSDLGQGIQFWGEAV